MVLRSWNYNTNNNTNIKSMKKLILIALLALSANMSAQLRVLPKHNYAAMEEKYFDAAMEGLANEDYDYLNELFDRKVVIVTAMDVDVIVLDYNLISATKVRVKGMSLILYIDGSKLIK